MRTPNRLKDVRESLMLSKAELARKAGVSPLTVDRVESGLACRLSTKRKLLLALGFDLQERETVFPELAEISQTAH